MAFLIVIIAILVIALIVFVTWFAAMVAEGKCPLCALKKLAPTKLTIDIDDVPDYDNGAARTPLMGWSSWNTMRNHIDEDTIVEVARKRARK